jgi:hypothetical protein
VADPAFVDPFHPLRPNSLREAAGLEPARPHVPKVVITTPEPTPKRPATPGYLTRIEIDGREWMVESYSVTAAAGEQQFVTLVFIADVTIVHPGAVPHG